MRSAGLLVLASFTMTHTHVEVHLLVHSCSDQIKDRNDVAREVFELSVKLRIELSQMFAIYF